MILVIWFNLFGGMIQVFLSSFIIVITLEVILLSLLSQVSFFLFSILIDISI